MADDTLLQKAKEEFESLNRQFESLTRKRELLRQLITEYGGDTETDESEKLPFTETVVQAVFTLYSQNRNEVRAADIVAFIKETEPDNPNSTIERVAVALSQALNRKQPPIRRVSTGAYMPVR